jgi:CelD/BcsL family acetyltransferase involved in cellulose biosynthesis
VSVRLRPADGPLADVAGEWRRLYSADESATPFSSPEWALAWERHLGDGARPLVLVAESGADIVGLIPLVRRRRGPFRTLEMLGEGPADYWDVLAEPAAADAVRQAFARWLDRNAGRWDALIVKGVVAGSATDHAIQAAGLRFGNRPPIIAPRLRLEGTFEDWLCRLPADRRSNVRRRGRRLAEAGGTIETLAATDDLPSAVERWQELRRRQWADRDAQMTPLHATGRFRAFMIDLVTALVPTGEVVFWEVRIGGDVVGSYINLADRRAFYGYLGGYDPSVSRLGIGTVVTAHGIAESIEAGRRHFDFLIGQERYKYWFEPDDEQGVWFTAAGTPRLRSRLALRAVDGFVAARAAAEHARAWRAGRG